MERNQKRSFNKKSKVFLSHKKTSGVVCGQCGIFDVEQLIVDSDQVSITDNQLVKKQSIHDSSRKQCKKSLKAKTITASHRKSEALMSYINQNHVFNYCQPIYLTRTQNHISTNIAASSAHSMPGHVAYSMQLSHKRQNSIHPAPYLEHKNIPMIQSFHHQNGAEILGKQEMNLTSVQRIDSQKYLKELKSQIINSDDKQSNKQAVTQEKIENQKQIQETPSIKGPPVLMNNLNLEPSKSSLSQKDSQPVSQLQSKQNESQSNQCSSPFGRYSAELPKIKKFNAFQVRKTVSLRDQEQSSEEQTSEVIYGFRKMHNMEIMEDIEENMEDSTMTKFQQFSKFNQNSRL